MSRAAVVLFALAANGFLPTGRAQEPAAPPPPGDHGPAIDDALRWLATHQDANGRFDADEFMKHDRTGTPCDGPGKGVHDVGATGLALLALLGSGSTLRGGHYRQQVELAVDWLQEQQQRDGRYGTAVAHDFVYDHAIAAFAICEAYGLSKHDALQPVAQKGLDYLEAHRNPYGVWRYQPRDGDSDTSVTTWALFALASGKSFGLTVDGGALQATAAWYDQVTAADGKSGYSKAGESSSRLAGDHAVRFPPEHGEAMTAAALAGRSLLGQQPATKPIMTLSADRVIAAPPQWRADRIDAYYWYMGTFAMSQLGGAHWQAWNRELTAIANAQRHDGNFAGSWDPVGVWDAEGGRVYATALYAMTLSIAHRAAKLRR